MTLRPFVRRVVWSFVFIVGCAGLVSAQMPDPKAMSGVPLPVGDLSPGTVTARVIRGQLSNPVEGVTVELAGGASKTAKTDNSGRATFTGVTPGARVKLHVTVGSETVASQEFEIPATGGIRVMLVATDPNAATVAAEAATRAEEPAVAGTVAFGPETRFVIEIGEDALNVFNMIQISNTAKTPVQTSGPLVFELPASAVGLGVMDGSSPQAAAAGRKVTVTGPFAPGTTVVQFGYSIPLGADTIDIQEKLPVALPQLSLVVQKIGAMQLASPQIGQRREMSADGNTYIVAQGGAMAAGSVLSLSLSGLPSRPVWPRNLAVGLAVFTLLAGAYAATRRQAGGDAPSRKVLQTRREKLFADLAALEAQRRKGTIDADTYARGRDALVSALEDLYRGLDGNVGNAGNAREVA